MEETIDLNTAIARDEHGFLGKYTIVNDYVRERRRQTREMFVPLTLPSAPTRE